jgi:hypothetical protein
MCVNYEWNIGIMYSNDYNMITMYAFEYTVYEIQYWTWEAEFWSEELEWRWGNSWFVLYCNTQRTPVFQLLSQLKPHYTRGLPCFSFSLSWSPTIPEDSRVSASLSVEASLHQRTPVFQLLSQLKPHDTRGLPCFSFSLSWSLTTPEDSRASASFSVETSPHHCRAEPVGKSFT